MLGLAVFRWLCFFCAAALAAPLWAARPSPPAHALLAPKSRASGAAPEGPALKWQSPARWCHGLKKTSGTLGFTESGVEFLARQSASMHWAFTEIQTFELSPRHLRLTGYENRRWPLHGERAFEFELDSPVPPSVASELARRVRKPVENGDPDPGATAFATLPARHRTRSGGTNGVLRFRETGIDYVTSSGRGARSWRWSDIQTLANPGLYNFRVGAYRETFEFELKGPMAPELFDRLWNHVYASDLSGLHIKEGAQP